MNDVTYHFLIPSVHSLARGEDINLLVGIHNHTEKDLPHRLRFFAQAEGAPFLLYEADRLLPAGETLHAYVTVPASALDTVDDEEFVLSLPDGQCAQLMTFRD